MGRPSRDYTRHAGRVVEHLCACRTVRRRVVERAVDVDAGARHKVQLGFCATTNALRANRHLPRVLEPRTTLLSSSEKSSSGTDRVGLARLLSWHLSRSQDDCSASSTFPLQLIMPPAAVTTRTAISPVFGAGNGWLVHPNAAFSRSGLPSRPSSFSRTLRFSALRRRRGRWIPPRAKLCPIVVGVEHPHLDVFLAPPMGRRPLPD